MPAINDVRGLYVGSTPIPLGGGGALEPYEEIFTAPGTWSWPGNVTEVEVMLVGGGGAGGNGGSYTGPPAVGNEIQVWGGGGGGGGVRFERVPVSAPVPVVIGAGGTSGPAATQLGGSSSFGPVDVDGGAGGGGFNTAGTPGTLTVPNISLPTLPGLFRGRSAPPNGGGGGGGVGHDPSPFSPQIYQGGNGGAYGYSGATKLISPVATLHSAGGGGAKSSGGGAITFYGQTAGDNAVYNVGQTVVGGQAWYGYGGGGAGVGSKSQPIKSRQMAGAGAQTTNGDPVYANRGGGGAGGGTSSSPGAPTNPSRPSVGGSGGSGIVFVRWWE